ncbi:MAG TPA: hypothetical protein VGV38_22715 [Pyrinomonadaceae bacterium]|nr:hypothetical protein [Pyrinomonadaceae bacterium]
MSEEETTVLFRPVGQKELDLIRASGWAAFPPRLPEQPIFYPVLNEEYAAQIARDWNAKHNEERVGYVTRFRVRTEYLRRFEVRTVGGSLHQEYWIPAGELPEFNRNIVGPVEAVAEYKGLPYGGVLEAKRAVLRYKRGSLEANEAALRDNRGDYDVRRRDY